MAMLSRVRVSNEIDSSFGESECESDEDPASIGDHGGESEQSTGESGEDSMDPTDSEEAGKVEDEDASEAKSGMADVLAKIIHKKIPDNKPAILAKSITDRQIQQKKRKKLEQENVDEDGSSSKKVKIPESESEEFEKQRALELKRKEWERMSRVKPGIGDREKERSLQRTATKGVVQLFNAVKKQQKLLDEKLKEVGSSELKRDKVMKSVSKGAFLDMLKGATPNISAEGARDSTEKSKTETSVCKEPDKEDRQDPSWQILRDNFMMGAKMKDWDKDSDSDVADNEAQMNEADSSDDDDR